MNFSQSDTGNPAKSARVALGSLIIKERLGTSDRETVLQIAENPYLQYFLGFSEYKDEPLWLNNRQKKPERSYKISAREAKKH